MRRGMINDNYSWRSTTITFEVKKFLSMINVSQFVKAPNDVFLGTKKESTTSLFCLGVCLSDGGSREATVVTQAHTEASKFFLSSPNQSHHHHHPLPRR
jgi:hypothetical protein